MASRTRDAGWIGTLCVLCACGRPSPTAAPRDHLLDLDAEDPVVIAGIELPPLPEDVDPADEVLAEGWRGAAQLLVASVPTVPEQSEEASYWVEEEFANWLGSRAQATIQLQRTLEEARQDEPRYSVVASVLLGLIYSRFALDIRGIETPLEMEHEAVAAHTFREALIRVSQAPLRRAIDAFGSCASVAASAPAYSLARWRAYCDEQIEWLEAARTVAPTADEPANDSPAEG